MLRLYIRVVYCVNRKMEAEFEAERIREEEREAERLAQRQKLQEEQLKERQQKVCGSTMIFDKFFLINKHYKIIITFGVIIVFSTQCFAWSYPLS